jgi:hypothetical protein
MLAGSCGAITPQLPAFLAPFGELQSRYSQPLLRSIQSALLWL